MDRQKMLDKLYRVRAGLEKRKSSVSRAASKLKTVDAMIADIEEGSEIRFINGHVATNSGRVLI